MTLDNTLEALKDLEIILRYGHLPTEDEPLYVEYLRDEREFDRVTVICAALQGHGWLRGGDVIDTNEEFSVLLFSRRAVLRDLAGDWEARTIPPAPL